ncbi:HAD-IIB family hydrolase [Salinispira pacifica]
MSEVSAEDLVGVDFVLTDIDDTLTKNGLVSCASYCALWQLHDAGYTVIPVTGRPAGWCDLIARQWPVDAVVGENGALVFYMREGKLKQLFHPDVQSGDSGSRLREIAEEVYRKVPGTRPAKDQFSRLFDVAVDFREEPPYLEFEDAEKIRRIFEASGASAKISSIHVNAWFGNYDKLDMTRYYFREQLGIDLDDPRQNRRLLFVGDSPNDEPMFGFFANSCAVANISPFLASLEHPPAYLTGASHGTGFAEVAQRLIAVRGAADGGSK